MTKIHAADTPYQVLSQLLDEENNRAVNQQLLEAHKQYTREIHKFYETNQDILKILTDDREALINNHTIRAKYELMTYRANLSHFGKTSRYHFFYYV